MVNERNWDRVFFKTHIPSQKHHTYGITDIKINIFPWEENMIGEGVLYQREGKIQNIKSKSPCGKTQRFQISIVVLFPFQAFCDKSTM